MITEIHRISQVYFFNCGKSAKIMASIRKRGNVWQADVRRSSIRKVATFETKTQARDWASKIEYEIKLGKVNPNLKFTLRDGFERYAREVSPTRKGARQEILRLRRLGTYPIADIRISKLTANDIASWRNERLEKVKPASVRREMNLLSSVIKRAIREWGWLNENPMALVELPSRSKPRDRRISKQEMESILLALGYSIELPIESSRQLVGAFFLIALETGMRLGEICRTSESDYYPSQRYVLLSDTKNNDARKVPLSKQAMRLFERVFESGSTIEPEHASVLFRKARITAGIEDLTFHDTRHEALTRLAGKLHVLELARMVGHRDPKSLMIYYNATPLELAQKLD